jgi:subtilisin family serine protease
MRLAGVLAIAASLLAGDVAARPCEPVRYVPGLLLVEFVEATPRPAIARSLARVGARSTGTVPGLGVEVVAVERGREAVVASLLRTDPAVERAERDVVLTAHETTPNDPFWFAQTGSQEISAPGAWDLTRGSQTTVVAVLDSGIDAGHPDLAGSTRPGYDFVNGDADPADDNGHGTETAGVISARGNNSTGVAGICWTCSILPVKVTDGVGEGTTAALASGIVWAADHGARVINMSLGGPGTTQTLAAAVRYAAGRGVVLVASAGNEGTTTPMYPAAYPEVIGVAASTPSKTLYPFSNRGAWVRLAAPGCNPTTFPAGAYVIFCGTSSSAPLVSGVAALAVSLRPTATKAVVERALESSAKPLSEPGVRYGQVDALGALLALEETFRAAEASSGPVSPPALSPPASPPPASSPPAPSGTRPLAPVASRAPSVAGKPRVGRALRANRGSWAGTAPIAFRYRWYRCRSLRSGCTPIPRALGLRYRLVRKDRGLRIRFSVTARNAAGAAFRISKPTARVRR